MLSFIMSSSNKNQNPSKKAKVYFKLDFKSYIFVKDKGNIRVYKIISDDIRINGLEIYQLESNKKYYLRDTVGATKYYDSVKDLLKANRNNLPKESILNILIKKAYKYYNFLNHPKIKQQRKYIIVFLVILSFIYVGLTSVDFKKYVNSFKSDITPVLPEVLFEKYKSSVVLIASLYYYEVTSGNTTFYYSPGSAQRIFFSKEDVMNNLSFSSGTGFIVSENGEILTNNHVVNNKDENYKIELANFYDKTKLEIIEKINRYNDTIEQLKSTYYRYSDQMDEGQKQYFEKRYDYLNNDKMFFVSLYKSFENIDFNSFSSKLIIYKLGIAYNDTFVTEFDDLQECVVKKTSDNEKVDLALIQTKNKLFNSKPRFIFNFTDNNPNLKENPGRFQERDLKNPIKINEDVFMIGFNKGFSLANTKQGIKSQFTSGKISQEYDGERILYTIPTLGGSSGSPIFDKWGNLVGVNFAKITDSQNFSFGVPIYEVKKFYEGN